VPHATACRALGVSPAWFYTWRHGDPSPQHARRAQLGIEIGRLFAKRQGRYGSPRITADLRRSGRPGGLSVDATAQTRRRIAVSLRRHPRRSTPL
jgi:putative transposase